MGSRCSFEVTLFTLLIGFSVAQYTPDWASLDTRPLPTWYDSSKLGIFIHWGVFSVPSFRSEWFWNDWASQDKDVVKFMADQYSPRYTYQDFAVDFDAYHYDPSWWADLIKASGAKYVVLTSKHHEGYTLWPSNVSFSWNAMDVGPKRDVLGDLANAVRNNGLHFGLYHSLFEWYNPLYLQDKANGYNTTKFVSDKTMPELREIVNTYQPEVIWSDGDWEASDTYWNSTEFLAWLYNDSPVKNTVVTNDRWGSGILCRHGDFWTCSDRYNPGVLIPHKWENCYTLDKSSWGYRREASVSDYLTSLELITALAETVSCGGNLLLNMGPRKDGTIDPIMEERLRDLGAWMQTNGDAIYDTLPWIFQNETKSPVWYTAKSDTMRGLGGEEIYTYAIVLQWPGQEDGEQLYLSRIVAPADNSTTVSLLGYNQPMPWKLAGNGRPGILVDFSGVRYVDMPSTIAWVLMIDNLTKEQQRFHPAYAKFAKRQ